MIQKIALQNMKGLSIHLDLAHLAVIAGGNFAGKSTILQAIVLALNGHLPVLGKQHKQTFRASSGSAMTVQAQLSDGTNIIRQWKQSGKAIKYTGPKGPVEQAVSILSGEAFTAARPADRLAMLAMHAGGSLDDLDREIARITRNQQLQTTGAETSLESADMLLEALDEEITQRKARKVQFEKTLQGLSELAALDTTGEPEDLTTKVADALDRARQAERALESAENAVTEGHDAAAALEAYLAQFPDANVEPEHPEDSDTVALQRQLREATQKVTLAFQAVREAERQALVVPFDEDEAAKLEELEALEKEKDWAKMQNEAVRAMSTARARREAAAKRIADTEKRIRELEALNCCPTCKTDGTAWKAPMLENLTLDLKVSKADVKAATEAEAAADADEVLALGNHRRLADLAKLRQSRRAAEVATAAAASLPGLRDKAAELEKEESAIETRIHSIEETSARFRERLTHHQTWKRLAVLVKPAAELSAAVTKAAAAFEEAVEAHNALKQQDEEQEPMRVAWQAKLGRQRDIAAATGNVEDEEDKITELVESRDALKSAVDTELKKLYEPIVSIAQTFSDGLLPSPLALDPTTAQIGRWEDTTFIPFELMSGAEQLVAIASLQVGLAAAGSGIVLLDELSRMRPEVKAAFATRIEDMVMTGGISQAILIDHTSEGYSSGWQITTMGE